LIRHTASAYLIALKGLKITSSYIKMLQT